MTHAFTNHVIRQQCQAFQYFKTLFTNPTVEINERIVAAVSTKLLALTGRCSLIQHRPNETSQSSRLFWR